MPSESARPISVLCVEDHALVREGIGLIIDSQPDMRVVASAASGEDAAILFRRHRPDITLMDMALPGISGVEAIQAIRAEDPDARIIVLTMHSGEEDIHSALQSGAAAYLLKETLSKDLVRVIREVHAEGTVPVQVELAVRLAERATHRGLTAREREVLNLIAEGKRDKEIGARLGISPETVHAHVKHLFEKLEVSDRASAVKLGIQRGLVRRE